MKTEFDKEFFSAQPETVVEVGSGSHFIQRAEKELKRAERYLSFVSLITFEYVPSGGWDEESKKKATEVLERSVRETDIVGVLEKHLAVLLVETPRRGAERAAERIAAQLAELCSEKRKAELGVSIHSFPEDPQGKENFLSALKTLR